MTLTVEDLALTPKQLAELKLADPKLVAAWLEATELNTGLKSPAGWFVSGVRSGEYPGNLSDAKQRHATLKAEAIIANAGQNLTEDEMLQAIFSPPKLTASLEFLERFELETRTEPGRYLFDGTLKAAIADTREHGQRVVPRSHGPLNDHDTPALRSRMTTLWREKQAVGSESVASTDDDIPF